MGSAIVILVPEADELVGERRLALDPVAARGVPAHVTVLYPFRRQLDDVADAAIAEIAARMKPFGLSFASAESFDDGVVYLVPSPDEPVRRLTAELARAFPDCPPYGGTVGEPTPHLTVGHRLESDAADRLLVELATLPAFASRIERLSLLVEDGDRHWAVERHWPIGRRAS